LLLLLPLSSPPAAAFLRFCLCFSFNVFCIVAARVALHFFFPSPYLLSCRLFLIFFAFPLVGFCIVPVSASSRVIEFLVL
jgi:hypothetical protein